MLPILDRCLVVLHRGLLALVAELGLRRGQSVFAGLVGSARVADRVPREVAVEWS